MAKPTLLQSLLNRPSQTYSFPQEKMYYSTKRDMVRIATETDGREGPHTEDSMDSNHIVESAAVRKDPRQLMVDDVYDEEVTSQGHLSITDLHNVGHDIASDSDSDSELDVFYTPNSSPRSSIATKSYPGVRSTTTPVMHSNHSATSLSSSIDAPSLFSLPASDSTRVTTPVNSDAGHTAKPPLTNQDWAKDVRWLVPDRGSAPETKSTITPSPSLRRRRHTSETHVQLHQVPFPPPPKSHSHPQTRSKPNTSISKSISKTNPSIMSSMAALLEEDEPHPCDQNPRSSVLISRSASLKQNSRNRIPSSPSPVTSTPVSGSRSPSPHNLSHKRSRSLGHASAPHFNSSTTPPSSNHSHSSHSHRRSGFASSSSDPFRPTSTSLPTFTSGNLPSHGTRGFTSLVLPRAPVPFSQSSRQHQPRIGAGLMDTIGAGAGADGKVDLTRSGVAQTTMASVEVVYGLSGEAGSSGSGVRILGKGKVGGKGVMGLFRRGGSASPSSSSTVPSSAFGTKSPIQDQRKRSRSENGMIHGNGNAMANGQSAAHAQGPERPLGFTSYRKPPGYVPSGSVLVQVWAVGVDGVDGKLVLGGASGLKERSLLPLSPVSPDPELDLEPSRSTTPVPLLSGEEKVFPSTTPKRTMNFRSTLGLFAGSSSNPNATPKTSPTNMNIMSGSGSGGVQPTPPAGVGYIPGRSFVGRVLECGWEVGEEIGKRGDWVVGLLDVKKCGALTEFIVVDRRRIHRIPYPRMDEDSSNPFLAEGEEDNRSSPGHSRSSSFRSTSNSRRSTSSRHSHSQSSPFHSPSPSRHASVNSRYGRTRPAIPSPLNLHAAYSARQPQKIHPPPLTLEEMALLPVCGIPAYRAVRTFAFEFAAAGGRDEGGAIDGGFDFGSVDAVGGSALSGSSGTGGSPESAGGRRCGREKEGTAGRDHERGGRRRRALVMRGHDGAGAMAVQMLVRRGWRVCVHVPFGCVRDEAHHAAAKGNQEEKMNDEDKEGWYQYCMRMVEERIRAWGGEEVIFDDGEETDGDDGRGAAVRAIDRLRIEGDMFDAVLDTIGGKEVWEASERLLRSLGRNLDAKAKKDKKNIMCVKQFTTLVGDSPGRTIPSAKDNLKAGFRSLNISVGRGVGGGEKQEGGGKVGYAWVSVAHDVDWEGEDVSETLDAVLRLTVEDGVRPWVGPDEKELGKTKGKSNVKCVAAGRRVMSFEKAPEVFVSGSRALADGGTVVIKVVG